MNVRMLKAGLMATGALWLPALACAQTAATSTAPTQMAVTAADGSQAQWPTGPTAPKGAPNVVVILLDDVGYAAARTFGGIIDTPGMSSLAKSGVSYNNFHVTALCSPTRAALLTGRNSHRVGFGQVMEMANGFPGYNGIWNKQAGSVAKVLQLNGYSTAAFGKWHNTPYSEISPMGPFDRWPTGLGFDHFFGFMSGDTDQYHPMLYQDTQPVEPELGKSAEPYNLGADLTDRAIDWLKVRTALTPDRPYFLYFATGATHEPLQPPAEWVAKYHGKFARGWDVLREETFARQKDLGFIPKTAVLTPRPAEIPAWDSLSPEEKKIQACQMEVFAGFLDYTDHQIKKLVDFIRSQPDGNNTLILYVTGDNGASAEGGIAGRDVMTPTGWPTAGERLDRMKEISQLNHLQYSAGWAWATTSPFQWMKQIASHYGGTTNPLIVSWPKGLGDASGIRTQFTHVTDIVPTIYELIGITPPKSIDGTDQISFDGISFAYSLNHPNAKPQKSQQIFETLGSRAVYKDGWIAGARHSYPWNMARDQNFAGDKWELYNVAKDFSQSTDLAAKYPEKLKELQILFDREAAAQNVLPLNNFWTIPDPKTGAVAKDISERLGAMQPKLGDGRTKFILPQNMPRIYSGQGPNFNKSHTITTEIQIDDGAPEGVIISNGNRSDGFVLYVKGGEAIYEYSRRGVERTVMKSGPLPKGPVSLILSFARDQEGPGGSVSFEVNKKRVSSVAIPRFEAPGFSNLTSVLSVGRNLGESVSANYSAPFAFTRKFESVTVDLGSR